MRMRALALLCLLFFSFELHASFLYECRESLKSESAESTEIILEALGYDDCKALDAEKDSIEEIWINNENFQNGQILSHFPNLRIVSIIFSKMSNVSWMATLNQLYYVRLIGNPIENIASMASLPNLRFLSLGKTKVTSIEPILGHEHLEELYIYLCHNLKSINGISNLKSLKTLSVYSNRLDDLSEIRNMPNLLYLNVSYSRSLKKSPTMTIATNGNLERLVIAHSELKSTKHLSKLNRLRSLDIAGTGISDINELSGLERLEFLNASRNKIVDVGPLSNLAMLKTAKLNSNMIDSVAKLKNHPALEVVSFASNPISSPENKDHESCPIDGSNRAIYSFCSGID